MVAPITGPAIKNIKHHPPFPIKVEKLHDQNNKSNHTHYSGLSLVKPLRTVVSTCLVWETNKAIAEGKQILADGTDWLQKKQRLHASA